MTKPTRDLENLDAGLPDTDAEVRARDTAGCDDLLAALCRAHPEMTPGICREPGTKRPIIWPSDGLAA